MVWVHQKGLCAHGCVLVCSSECWRSTPSSLSPPLHNRLCYTPPFSCDVEYSHSQHSRKHVPRHFLCARDSSRNVKTGAGRGTSTYPAEAEKDMPRTFHCLRSSLRLSGSVRVVPQWSTSISWAVAMPEGNRRFSARIWGRGGGGDGDRRKRVSMSAV